MPPTREVVSELVEVLKTLHEPITVQELCEHCKKFHGRPDKVKQGLQELETNGMVENIGDEYMLTVNITEQIRHKWIMQVFNREANIQTKSKLSDCATYAEAIKRWESAPGDLVGAYGSDLVGASGSRSIKASSSDTTDHKDYKRSVSDTSLVPGPSRNRTQAAVLHQDQPYQIVEQTIINQHQTVNHHQTIVHHHHNITYSPQHNNITYSPQHNTTYSPQYNQCEINNSYDRHHHVNQSGDNACLQIGNQNEANFQTVQARQGKKKKRTH